MHVGAICSDCKTHSRRSAESSAFVLACKPRLPENEVHSDSPLAGSAHDERSQISKRALYATTSRTLSKRTEAPAQIFRPCRPGAREVSTLRPRRWPPARSAKSRSCPCPGAAVAQRRTNMHGAAHRSGRRPAAAQSDLGQRPQREYETCAAPAPLCRALRLRATRPGHPATCIVRMRSGVAGMVPAAS